MIKSKAFRNFVLTFFCFFLCFLLLLLPLYSQTLRAFSQKQLALNEALLWSGIERMDSQLERITLQVQQISQDSRYRRVANTSPSSAETFTMLLLNVQNDFTRQVRALSLLSDCGILYHNGFVLTRNRHFPTDVYWDAFYGNYLHIEGYDTLDAFCTAVGARQTAAMLPVHTVTSSDYGRYDALIWIVPIFSESVYGYVQNGFFYAMLPVDALIASLATDEIIRSGAFSLEAVGGQTLYAPDVDGAQHASISGLGAFSGIRATVSIPRSLFTGQVAPIRQMMMFFLALTVFVGIMLILLFAHRSSKPIRRLAAQAMQSYAPAGQAPLPEDEYEVIGCSMRIMDQSIEQFKVTIQMEKMRILENLFDRMIRGTVYHERDIVEFKRLFPFFPKQYRLALLRFIEQKHDTLHAIASRSLVSKTLIEERLHGLYYAQSLENNMVLLVLPCVAEQAVDPWHAQLLTLRAWLEGEYRAFVQIGLSDMYDHTLHLPLAFAQTLRILRGMAADDEHIGTALDLPQDLSLAAIAFPHMQQLYEALYNGECKIVQSLLGIIERRIAQENADNVLHEGQFQSLYFVFDRVRGELLALLPTLELPVYSEKVNLAEQLAAFWQCAEVICEAVRRQKPPARDETTNRVLAFIESRFDSNELYTKTVMSAFQISETKLQKIIRTATGKSFFEYVEDLRLTKARRLLISTEMATTQIATACGFASYNSMYKSFQRKYNASPGVIRKTR